MTDGFWMLFKIMILTTYKVNENKSFHFYLLFIYIVTWRFWRRCHKGNDPTEEGISEGSSSPWERVHPLLFKLIIIFLFLLCCILISPQERGGVAEWMAAWFVYYKGFAATSLERSSVEWRTWRAWGSAATAPE